jgi:uncharacterized protein YfaP (DUF2135 family)
MNLLVLSLLFVSSINYVFAAPYGGGYGSAAAPALDIPHNDYAQHASLDLPVTSGYGQAVVTPAPALDLPVTSGYGQQTVTSGYGQAVVTPAPALDLPVTSGYGQQTVTSGYGQQQTVAPALDIPAPHNDYAQHASLDLPVTSGYGQQPALDIPAPAPHSGY